MSIKPVYIVASLVIICCIFHPGNAAMAQQDPAEVNEPVVTEQDPERGGEQSSSPQVTLNSSVYYGMYSTILAQVLLAGDVDSFSYQLSSNIDRIDDHIEKGSGRFTGSADFSGSIRGTEQWTLLPSVSFITRSNGLYDNTVFSTEDSGKISLGLDNQVRIKRSQFNIGIEGDYCFHSLEPLSGNSDLTRELFQAKPSFAWNYLWSAANRIGVDTSLAYTHFTDYPDEYDINWDLALSGQIKLFEYLVLGVRPRMMLGRDLFFAGGMLTVSTSGLKRFYAQAVYRYDVTGTDYRKFYSDYRYLVPDHTLREERIHDLHLNAKYEIADQGVVRQFNVTLQGGLKVSDGFLAVSTAADQDLSRLERIEGLMVQAGPSVSALFDFKVIRLGIKGEYMFQYQVADRNITYLPEHQAKVELLLKSRYINVSYINTLQALMYTSPDSDEQEQARVNGSLVVDVVTAAGLSLSLSVTNLYNQNLIYRQGYREPGITLRGGLKVIL